jgi:hypothetical protein
MRRSEESSTMDGMPIRRQRVFLDGNQQVQQRSRGRTNVDRNCWTLLDPAGPKSLLSWMKLCEGSVEIALDHEDGDIIAKANVFRKIRRAAEDVVHERFRG